MLTITYFNADSHETSHITTIPADVLESFVKALLSAGYRIISVE